MVRLADLNADLREFLVDWDIPDIEGEPWTPAPTGPERRYCFGVVGGT